jgi:AraC-like DNA-binding protein
MKIPPTKQCPHVILSSHKKGAVKFTNVGVITMVWVSKNRCNCTVNFSKESIAPNTLLFFNEGEVFICDNDNEAQIDILSFNAETFSSSSKIINSVFNFLLQREAENYVSIAYCTEQSSFINEMFDNIMQCINDSEFTNLEKIKIYVNAIITESMGVKFYKDYKFLLDFVNTLNNQYKIHHDVFSYAEELDVNSKDLLRHFQKLGFQKPSTVIKKRLLLEAKFLLVYSNKTAKEICFEIGFDDPAYFARFFKKNTEMTPLNFRKTFKDTKSNTVLEK